MNWRFLLVLAVVAPLFLINSCTETPVFKENETLFKIGDQKEWANKHFNDQDWNQGKPKMDDGQVFWFRTPIDILQNNEDSSPYGIRLEVYGEYEVFWDGVLIGKNGNPGQEKKYGPKGKMWTTHSIPSALTEKGQHMLAIRGSLYWFADHAGIWSLDINYYDKLVTNRLIEIAFMHVLAGAFLIASFYFLFLFLSNKKEYPMLIFSACCFLFFVLIIAEFSEAYLPVHYSQHRLRLQSIGVLMLGISFLIPFYFSMLFPFPKRQIYTTLYGAVLLFIFLIRYDFFLLTARYMATSMWLYALGMVVYAVYKKKKGSITILSTLLLCVAINLIATFNISFYSGFGLILLGMFYLLSNRIKEQRLAYEKSLVQSTRLRLELLKKNIQPHFIMNTLTSLIDWVEEAPDKGVLFIEALAKEFDLVNRIENEKLIPIEQEIALCKAHIEIMEYRKEIHYTWEDEGIDAGQKIPPAILHTLLENGITHSLPLVDNTIKFKLIFESNAQYVCYTFLTYANRVRAVPSKIQDGTGIQYIKARLTESYQSEWEFSSEPTDYGWKNIVILYIQ